jgi:glycosyltransferase involved in cell wall biosynthesis
MQDIIVVRQDNRGAAAARNAGAYRAKSDFLAFLDADDEWSPDHLEMLLDLRDQYPEAGIYTTAYKIGTRYANYEGIPTTPRSFLIPDYFRSATLGEFPVNASSFGVAKSVFSRYGGFPEGKWWGEDAYFFGVVALDNPVAFSWDGEAIYHREDSGACVRPNTEMEPIVSANLRGDFWFSEYVVKKELYRAASNLYVGNTDVTLKILQNVRTQVFQSQVKILSLLSHLPNPVVRRILRVRFGFI